MGIKRFIKDAKEGASAIKRLGMKGYAKEVFSAMKDNEEQKERGEELGQKIQRVRDARVWTKSEFDEPPTGGRPISKRKRRMTSDGYMA